MSGGKVEKERNTCEERIDNELKDRIEDIKEIVESKDPVEAINEYGLALSKTVNYKLELSWGGPQDYFIFEYDPDSKELVGITYHFLDWFDAAQRRISSRSKEWEILEQLFYSCILIE